VAEYGPETIPVVRVQSSALTLEYSMGNKDFNFKVEQLSRSKDIKIGV
jgi:hypothetical protein